MRLTLIAPTFPKLSESFIVNKFCALTATDEVTVVCQQRSVDDWAKFAVLRSRPNLARRIRTGWPHTPLVLLPVLVPLALLHVLCQTPRVGLRYLYRGWRRFGLAVVRRFYLDAPVILSHPDIVHFEFGTLAVEKMYLPELLNCRSVVSFRGYDLNYVALDTPEYYEQVWRRADAIHCLGEDLWARAQRRGCPPGKVHALIPPAIDVSFFKAGRSRNPERAGSAERPVRLLSVGRLEWKKGYEYALEAVAALRARGVAVDYRIIGAGEQRESITFCRHQLDLEAAVTLLGPRPAESVREQMEWADVFVHAAVSEGFCNAVLEAQAMELPVVTSDADGLGANVADGVTGFVVPRRDPAALADRIGLLAADPDLRQRMGVAGRQRVVEHHRLDDQIAAFRRLYQRVLEAAP